MKKKFQATLVPQRGKRDYPILEFREKTMANIYRGMLINICRINDLKTANNFFKHKKIHRYTWTQNSVKLK